MIDLAIVGGGPAGLTAGLYATRGGLKKVIMFEKGMPGGLITQSSEIENYPGVCKKLSGLELMECWPKQCQKFGLKHEMEDVIRIEKNSNNSFSLLFANRETIEACAVIIATGSTPKKAGFEGEEEFFGRGVSTCATCDGFFYKNREVAVLGGGDTALEEALYLANICKKVYLIHRRDKFIAVPATIERVRKNPKIELILNTKVIKAYGSAMGLEGIILQKEDKETDLKVPGIFVFVGMNVNNEILKQKNGEYLCKLNQKGEIIVDLKMKTDIDGLFAAGDVRSDSAKQVVCAAGDGAVAALSAISYIESLKEMSLC